jgi:hypothetical protein
LFFHLRATTERTNIANNNTCAPPIDPPLAVLGNRIPVVGRGWLVHWVNSEG